MAIKVIKTAFLFLIVAFFIFSTWLIKEFSFAHKSSPGKIFFEVEKGKDAEEIAKNLKDKGLIRKKWPFLLSYKLFFPESIKAGEYAFSLPLSTKDILTALVEGNIYLHSLTIPEGLTAKEIFKLLSTQGFGSEVGFEVPFSQTEAISSWDKEAQNLEGYLFPETYRFPKGTPPEKIIATMVSQFKLVFNEEKQKRAKKIGLIIREVVIMASLIEKEASIPKEKKLVAAVFHNRLKRGMKLDCDPTIIYALKQEGRFKDRLRTKDLKYDTPYNTYLYSGLPPGPICNPGRESLQAALFPSEENYLYFVSKNDGSHQFSRTFKEHQRAVLLYQKRKN